LIRTVRTYIETNHLLSFDKPVITGFSGGGDSVSLLFILKQLGYDCIAAHCNFHLRGDESDRDAAFCRTFAEEQGIRFEQTDFDTEAYSSRHHISVEMAARALRYEWFEALRQKYGAQAIAVAHHADDNAETMLLNIIRGTGIRGMRGMCPQNACVVRPLLCVDRTQLNTFIAENGLHFVSDSSNLSEEYARNYLRLRLLPMMEEINPSVRAALARTAEHLADVEAIYLSVIDDAAKKILRTTGDEEFTIMIEDLMQTAVPKTVLYELLHKYGFTRTESEAVFRSLDGQSGKIFYAHKTGLRLIKDRNKLIISRPAEDIEYIVEDEASDMDNLPVGLSITKTPVNKHFVIDKTPSTASFDCESIRFPLTLRKWRAGDRFVPYGMNGFQKLSDFFSDRKYSLADKEKTWILCSGDAIIWIVGVRTDNRFRIKNTTKIALIINFKEKKLHL
jgi:tRNA(Ile)-lysidine synthase